MCRWCVANADTSRRDDGEQTFRREDLGGGGHMRRKSDFLDPGCWWRSAGGHEGDQVERGVGRWGEHCEYIGGDDGDIGNVGCSWGLRWQCRGEADQVCAHGVHDDRGRGVAGVHDVFGASEERLKENRTKGGFIEGCDGADFFRRG